MSTTFDKVKKIIVEQLGVDESEVTPEASITDDLGADSLDQVELVMAFETEFNIDIPGRRSREDQDRRRRGQAHRRSDRRLVDGPLRSNLFDQLSDRLGAIFARLSGRGRLSESDVNEALREVRVALLEADVSLGAAKAFVARVKEQALGANVLESLTPAQTIVKIVHDELVELLGGTGSRKSRLQFSDAPPSVIMLVGLQGSGKTTQAGKLALRLKEQGRRSLLVAADVYRPAAIAQLQTLGKQIDLAGLRDRDRRSGKDRARRRRRSQAARAFDRHRRYRGPPADRRRADGRTRAHQSAIEPKRNSVRRRCDDGSRSHRTSPRASTIVSASPA